ncbi:phytanoyl-CoA dioxygenase family protein [Betaproteobacteria bacterium LSUCC0117]|nr:phytanoyl-CoA dioxygenase family protein [Betaproteobacteria bacterium LSUCC0117]
MNHNIDEIKRHYVEHGWVLVKNLFPRKATDEFKNSAEALLLAFLRKAGGDTKIDKHDVLDFGYPWLKKMNPQIASQFYDALWGTSSFIRLTALSDFTEIIASLLNIDESQIYSPLLRCRLDPPMDQSRTYGWHQEIFYTIPNSNYLQTWAPLVNDIPTSVGALHVLDRSHRGGIAKQSWNEVEGKPLQILVDQEIVRKYEDIVIETEVGDMLFFDKHTIHASGSNTSKKTRYSFVGMYHDACAKEFKTPIFPLWQFRDKSARQYFEEHSEG